MQRLMSEVYTALLIAYRLATVRNRQAVVKVDQIIRSDGGGAGSSHAQLRGIQESGGLAGAVAGDERLFLRVADTTGKLGTLPV